MDFPHLKDNDFPLFNNVDVYAGETTFDYSKWVPNTKVRLVNVKFDDTYANVVDFPSARARDTSFDELSGHTTTLDREFRIDPTGRIKIPLPFDVAQTYNYLYIEYPKAPIEHEGDPRISRFYFFINDTVQKAPNTTELKLSLDVWTTYKPYVKLNSIMLKRGHYGVKHSATPQTFLADPLNHTTYLTADDVYVENGKRIPTGKALAMSSTKLVAFILPYAPAQLQGLVPAESGSGSTPATFSDLAGERWGEDYVVNGYEWQWGRNYSHMSALTPNAIPSQNIHQPNLYVYGVRGDDATAFFAALQDKNPNVFRDIQAVFVVESERVTMVDAFTYNGVQVYTLVQKLADFPITLTMADFQYPARYEKLTKLYTSPYAHVRVTDVYNVTHELKIQDLNSRTHLSVYTSLHMLKYFASIDYVGSDHTVTYDVHNWSAHWDDAPQEIIMNLGEFEKLLFTNDIPLYQVSMSARQVGDMDRFYQNDGQRERAIATYQNGVRNANTAQHNALDANATDLANALRDNATAQANVYASAATDNTNTHASANTSTTNARRSRNTSRSIAGLASKLNTNKYNTNVTAFGTGANSSIDAMEFEIEDLKLATLRSRSINDISETLKRSELQNNLALAKYTYDANYDAKQAISVVSGASSILSSGVGGLAAGSGGGAIGMGLGLGAGLLSGAANTASSLFSVNQLLGADEQILNASWFVQNIMMSNNVGADVVKNEKILAYNGDIVNLDNAFSIESTRQSTATDYTNTRASNNTAKANSNRARTTTEANADRSKITADTDIKKAIATSNANINYTREAGVLNLQNNLRVDQIQRAYQYYQNNFDPALAITQQGGDSFKLDQGRVGYVVKVVTPNENDLRQMGDIMLRYGYTLNEYVEPDELQVMQHFSYWETGDVFAVSELAPNKAVVAITSILQNGVTVWDNMDSVNSLTIYDNME